MMMITAAHVRLINIACTFWNGRLIASCPQGVFHRLQHACNFSKTSCEIFKFKVEIVELSR